MPIFPLDIRGTGAILGRMKHMNKYEAPALVAAIDAAAQKLGLSPATVTDRAIGSSTFRKRILAGRSYTVQACQKFYAWVDENVPS